MSTASEHAITSINQNVFYKEFTFDKNEFYPTPGEQKELADNIILLDDLLFIIQIKERNKDEIKTAIDENKWFNNVVLKKAKKQIKDSIDFFNSHPHILITNRREHTIDVSKATLANVNKIIIYAPNSDLLTETNHFLKFYESSEVGNIHLFHIEDYHWVCRYLITPAELNEYLKFRERIYIKHKTIINNFPEQYVLAHFLNTDDETTIDEKYIETLKNLNADADDYDIAFLINSFYDKIRVDEQKNTLMYYPIIREIAKLKRYELAEFKQRYLKTIEDVKANSFSLPYRINISRTGCGFVFIPLMHDKIEYWENALINFTEMYKYKRQLKKCLGVILFKAQDYYDQNWAYIESEWEYNEELEKAIAGEENLYGDGQFKPLERYRFND